MIIKSSTSLRNDYTSLSNLAHKESEPIYITKNGEGDLVVMSIEAFEKREELLKLKLKLEMAEQDRLSGDEGYSLHESKRRHKMYKFTHFNFNVLDLKKSLAFYDEALGLKPVRTVEKEDFTLVYLGDESTGFELELTYLKNRKEPYNLGECEFHLAMTTSDMEASLKKHNEMGVVCFSNEAMGIYFIQDPDGYWIEIIPEKK